MMIHYLRLFLVYLFLSEGFSRETVADDTFFNSAREGDTKYIEAYLEANPSLVSVRDSRGNNAVVIAAGRGRIEVLKILLKYRANPEDHTNSGLFEGKSALSWAASQGVKITVGQRQRVKSRDNSPLYILANRSSRGCCFTSSSRSECPSGCNNRGISWEDSTNVGE